MSLTQNNHAQTTTPQTLSLDSCVAIAFRNNPNLLASKLNVESNQKLQKTAFDLGKTEIFYENEDLNTNDKTEEGVLKIGFTQSIEFPTVWFAQSKFNKQNTLISKTNLALTEKDLLREIRSAYYNLLFAISKQKLLQHQDSIFFEFENAASLRFKTGETNKLELISAQARHREIQLAMEASQADVLIAQEQLMMWMNTQQPVLPDAQTVSRLSIPVSGIQDDTALNHPYLQLSQQKISLADYQRRVEVNKLLPDLSARYFNQNWYGASPGYYGYSFGIGIPLFFWSQTGRIQSAKLQQQVEEKNFENDQLQFNAAYAEAIQNYKKNLSLLSYYEQTGLQLADEILSSATVAYRNGEIGYIEYITLLSQSIDIKNQYLHSMNDYNQSVIKLNYFLNQ